MPPSQISNLSLYFNLLGLGITARKERPAGKKMIEVSLLRKTTLSFLQNIPTMMRDSAAAIAEDKFCTPRPCSSCLAQDWRPLIKESRIFLKIYSRLQIQTFLTFAFNLSFVCWLGCWERLGRSVRCEISFAMMPMFIKTKELFARRVGW